ncbi:MAG: type I restriction enzyme S subunit [Gammaproteobacteria bacterium]|jgi:type I restriction enzyme S subunit
MAVETALSAKYTAYPKYRDTGISGLGQIPECWEVMQLKRTVEGCVNGFWGGEPKNDGSDTVVLRVADFDRPKLTIQDDGYTFRKIEESEKLNRKLKAGDLLLEKSGGGAKTLVGQVVLFDKDFDAVTSNFVAKMTTNNGFSSGFLNYVFSRFYSANINFCSIKQNTGIQNLDSAAYLTEKFGFPLEDEQQKIANFLDHETAKIDTLIDKQQQLITLLKEKRQAVISHAVTKGLNPNAPMRDSGVEWLGEVPVHWAEVSRIKYISSLKGRQGWQGLKAEEYLDVGPYVVSSAHFTNHQIKWDSCPHVSPERYERDSNIQLAEDDLLLMKDGAAMGKLAYVGELPDKACLNSHLLLFRPINKNEQLAYSPRFMYYFMQTEFFQEHIKIYGTGVTFLGISQQAIGNYRLSFPALGEQEIISEFLANETNRLDELARKQNDMMSLLKERRTALISAAVTGKIDVRNWKAA